MDLEIHKIWNRCQTTNHQSTGLAHTIYYENQMTDSYKTDERVPKNIIRRNVRCSFIDDQLNVTIYYRNQKTRSLIMNNNPNKNKNIMQSTNVVYKFKCPHEDCKLRQNVEYIGLTATTLSRRLRTAILLPAALSST